MVGHEINLNVYKNLPKELALLLKEFNDGPEKDIMLLSILTSIGSVFNNVSAKYHRETIYPNLMVFIIAPPGAGKGKVKIGVNLIKDIPFNHILANSNQSLIIPGNISSAALIEQLKDNEGIGYVFESEADTISNIIGQDWGGFSDLLRKAFHHEEITSKRKEKIIIKIENPKLSILLTGTPNQILPFIGSVENGLFSRFSFYYFDMEIDWIDANPDNVQAEIQYIEQFKSKLENFCKLTSYNNYDFTLSKELWRMHKNFFKGKLKGYSHQLKDGPHGGIIRRLGLISIRIAIILEVCDYLDIPDQMPATIICKKQNLLAALLICDCLFHNNIDIASNLTQQKKVIKPKTAQNRLYEHLPSVQFTRAEAVQIGQNINIGERSVDIYLKKLAELGDLEKPKTGIFLKPKQT